MMNSKFILRALRGALAVALAGVALGVAAQGAKPPAKQSVQPPAGLKWQAMDEIDFNPIQGMPDTGTPEERTLLSKIWAKEINNLRSPTDGSAMFGAALIGVIQHADTKLILTFFDSFNSECIPSGNGTGSGPVDMYATCPLRLLWVPIAGQPVERTLQVNFCVLTGYSKNNPLNKNHNEYSFDDRTGILYLRLIQYGKLVPDCARAIRIF